MKSILINFTSRKFLILVLSTVLLFYGKITEITWAAIAGVYMGVNILDQILLNKKKSGE